MAFLTFLTNTDRTRRSNQAQNGSKDENVDKVGHFEGSMKTLLDPCDRGFANKNLAVVRTPKFHKMAEIRPLNH